MTTSGQRPAALESLRAGKVDGGWSLDPRRSEFRLASKSMWGLVPVRGVFRTVTGTGTVAPSGVVSGTVTVAAGSVDTKNAKRDEHLRSADFFDVARYPDITFTVSGVESGPAGIAVRGQLAVRGRTQPVTVDAAVTRLDEAEVQLEGTVQVNRADFGLTWNQLGMASMTTVITVRAVFTRQ